MIATTIHLIEKQAKLTPNKTAVSFNDIKMSYSELNDKANRMAGFFISKGISRGMVVGVAIDRSLELLISLLAVFKAGAAYVPLDPDYPNQRLEYMLNDAKARVLLTNSKYKDDLKTSATKVILEDVQTSLNEHDEAISLPGDLNYTSSVDVNKNDLAYILYTSGSTGHPKGVMIEHGNLLNLIQSIQKFPGLESDDKLLSLTTMSFDISVLEFFLPLTVGATLYLADSDFAKDGEAILALIKRENISFMQATPSTYKMMLAAEWDQRCNIKVICCGEQLPKDLAERILSKCARLFNMYGPTETTIYSTGKEILRSDEVITIGKPIQNTEVFILDANQQLLDRGESGEIYIAGEGVARGYFGKPDLTSEKFITWIYLGKAYRLYRTGDLGKILDNGEIQCFGRADDQIKIRGYRIEIGEIEYALLKQDNVKETLITSWTGPSGDPRIAAYVVNGHQIPKKHLAEEFAKWKQALRSMLPFYMIPNDFIIIDKFPLLENGKINRKELPPPTISSLQVINDTIPRSFLETMIAKVWAENLGIDNIGIHDNFFDLGGHSLTAVKVIVQIKKASGKYLPLGSLFNNPTIAKLAHMLDDEQERSNFSCLVPLKPNGTKAPLYIVHGLGSTVFKFYDFAHQLDDQQPVFGFQAKGVDELDKPAESIESMASEYIAELLRHNSEGPYNLSGYSMGGIVAFEMLRQLAILGKKVNVLAVFDSFIVEHDQMAPGVKKTIYKYTSRVKKFLFTFQLLYTRPKRTIDHKLFTIKRQLSKLIGKPIGNETGLDENFDQIGKIMSIHRQAVSNYQLKKLDIVVHLFKAKIAATYLDDFKYLGWRPFANKLIVHEIDGDHTQIFDTGINHAFAKSLQRVLDESKS